MAAARSLFSFRPERTLTGLAADPALAPGTLARGRARGEADDGAARPVAASSFSFDNGTQASEDDLADQFIVFQFSPEPDGPALLDSSTVQPALVGDEEAPDVLARINLVSFHLGRGEPIEPGTRATMRLNFGRDPSATGRFLDNAFWAVAAGFRLHDEATGRQPNGRELAADINRALGNRPVEIPGGLSLLSFEVVRHREPPWYRQVFDFLRGGSGQALTAVLGFPAITQSAIGAIDQLIGRLDKTEPQVLFKSAPMRLALTRQAHDEFTGGNPRIRLGSLAPGYCLMARGRDLPALLASDPIFLPTHGLLAPAAIAPSDFGALTHANPLNDLTYAVFQLKMKSGQLDPAFSFRG